MVGVYDAERKANRLDAAGHARRDADDVPRTAYLRPGARALPWPVRLSAGLGRTRGVSFHADLLRACWPLIVRHMHYHPITGW